MMITAHGGALKTGRNTTEYFDAMTGYSMEAVEVDIRLQKGVLVLAHFLPPFFKKNAVRLEDVFEYCKKNNFKVNCDVKEKGMVAPVLALAKACGASEYLYFTGNVMPYEIEDLTDGAVFVNTHFYEKEIPLKAENLAAIKKYLESFGNARIYGINIPYRYADDAFLAEAERIGLKLSVYTVDDAALLERLIKRGVYNITTNTVDTALNIREALNGK
ncbi:MAG: glycerophosphodiester phosphodiesterase [Clostridiales bacterium]|jgi:glycerophosphoryl diester phosphodiesterase|nr:glycerophosphodiester phosphodiesterase [Clostridiales bacterium]